MRFQFKDPFSGLSHLFGAFVGICILIYLINKSLNLGDPWRLTASIVFGMSIILLYASSSVYHLSNVSDSTRRIMRQVDHSMIFVFIAGSYTPFCLIPLRGPMGWSLLAFVWGTTLLGVYFKIFKMGAHRWLSTGLYLAQGWIALAVIFPLYKVLSVNALLWLFGGGLSYSVGAVIYALKKPNPFPPHFGFHEIWHLFVLAGSFCHFMGVNEII